MNHKKATLIGFIAIFLWSSVVGLIRGVSEDLGPVGGAAMIFTVASVFLFLTMGGVRWREFPRQYLFWGALLFVTYEICLSLAIGYAKNSQQAIEVGMVNYLWPTFTMVASILFNKQKTNLLIIPGVIFAMAGICFILGGDHGINFHEMSRNILSNPLSYGLAFMGALIWAAYCTVTVRIAQGKNGAALFFILLAIVLWLRYFAGGGGAMNFHLHTLLYLLLAASAMGFGYATWNVGILHGNVTILAGASYFIPVLSAALAAALLHTPLSMKFWQGAAMVCTGSILCWLATRDRNGP
jgi:drug/metabolite transporter (DMT)-like permease